MFEWVLTYILKYIIITINLNIHPSQMSNQNERFSALPSRETRLAKADESVKSGCSLSEQELAQLSPETLDYFNVARQLVAQAIEQRMDLAA
jgi:hypothetical protein